MAFEDDVVAVLQRLPPGDVVTYGEVAEEAGRPGAARAVGGVLARTDAAVPWWRVVTATGRLAPGKEREQARRLRAEGVEVEGHRVRWLAAVRRPPGRPRRAPTTPRPPTAQRSRTASEPHERGRSMSNPRFE